MATVTIGTLNDTLLSIKRDTQLTARALSGRGTSAQEAREGIKARPKAVGALSTGAASVSKPKSTGSKSSGGSGFLGRLLSGDSTWKDIAKLMGLGAIGLLFKQQISDFFKGLYKGFKEYLFGKGDGGKKGLIGEWWDKKKVDIEKSWTNLKNVTGFTWIEEESEKLLKKFKGWGTKLDKWIEESFVGNIYKDMKAFLFGKEVEVHTDAGTEITREGGVFGGLSKYVKDVGLALKDMAASLGLINKIIDPKTGEEDWEVSALGWTAGLVALATLGKTIGLKGLLKLPFKVAGKTFGTVFGLLGWFTSGLIGLGASMFGGGAAAAATGAATGATGAVAGGGTKPLKPGSIVNGKVVGVDGKFTTTSPTDKKGIAEIKRLASEKNAARGGFRGLLSRLGLTMAGFAAGGVATLGAMAAVAGVGAAVYGLYKLAEYEDESRKGRVGQAIRDKTISQESVDFARAAAVADMKDHPGLKSFEEWEKSKGLKPITGDTGVEQRLRAERQQEYQEEHSDARAELEERVTDILSNFIEDKRGKQLDMVSDLAQGRGLFGRMLKKGVISLKEGVPINEAAKELTTYIKNNPGKPITREVMEDAGIVFSEGFEKKEFMVPNVRRDHAFAKKSSLSTLEGFDPETMTMMGLGVKSGAFGQNFNERYQKLNELQKMREEQLRKETQDRQSNAGNTGGGMQIGAINVQGSSGTAVPPPVLVGGLDQTEAANRGLGLVHNIG